MASSIPAQSACALHLSRAAKSFASSATLQALFGVSTEDDALGRIYCNIVEDDGSQPRPRLLVESAKAAKIVFYGYSSSGSAQIMVTLEFDVPSDAALRTAYSLASDAEITVEDRRMHLANVYGNITSDLKAVCKSAGYLELSAVEEFAYGQVLPETEGGDQFFVGIWILHFDGEW
jgi:hypothetical protein